MTFYDKYPQLKQKVFLTEMLTETVFATMSLEDQQVSKEKIEKIVMSLLLDENLENSKLSSNQIL